MAKYYIPIAGGFERGREISQRLYQLSQPPGVRPAHYGSTEMLHVLRHPETEAAALVLDASYFVPVHVAADPAGFADFLRTLTDDHGQPLISAGERDALVSLVLSRGGQQVFLAELLGIM